MPQQMKSVLLQLFSNLKFSPADAELLAKVHTQSTMCGVNSHGINRVPIFCQYVKDGVVKPSQGAVRLESFGQIERWDGRLGSGVLNATTCTQRAIQLAKANTLGLVALKNTNHWMRAGTYGWQAANEGCIGIMFTNTQANMPPWGATECRIGNNPLAVSIPKENGHVVLDMAMSQFSFGKIHEYELRGESLPFAGGWDESGKLTHEPKPILANQKALPAGYWKGSALSMVLDILATLLSAGSSTKVISETQIETGISQVFLCIDAKAFNSGELNARLLKEIIDYTQNVQTQSPTNTIKYPGERALESYKRSKEHGMPVNAKLWSEINSLLLD